MNLQSPCRVIQTKNYDGKTICKAGHRRKLSLVEPTRRDAGRGDHIWNASFKIVQLP